jgi:uncharacterized cupin superfamily protein
MCYKLHIVINDSKLSTKYLYINETKPWCQILFSSHNNAKQSRQNTQNKSRCLTKPIAIANYMDYPPSYQHVHLHQSLTVKRQCGVKE